MQVAVNAECKKMLNLPALRSFFEETMHVRARADEAQWCEMAR